MANVTQMAFTVRTCALHNLKIVLCDFSRNLILQNCYISELKFKGKLYSPVVVKAILQNITGYICYIINSKIKKDNNDKQGNFCNGLSK